MSLLIKALDKAQEAKVKQEQSKKRDKSLKAEPSELTLSPPEVQILETPSESTSIPHSILESAATVANKETSVKAPETFSTKSVSISKSQTSGATQTQAANVFSSKRVEATHQNTKLAIIAGSGLIALLAMGVYYYQFVGSVPDVPMPPIRTSHVVLEPTPQQTPAPPQVVAEAPTQSLPKPDAEITPAPNAPQAFAPHESASEPTNETKKISQKRKAPIADAEAMDAESTLDANEEVVAPSKKSAKSNMVKMDKAIASESASIQVSQSKPQDAVNPMVMRAYEAYNAGKDAEAQKFYKQALQRDGLNLDALLGLGAIATRQGRVADADGWYRKVLELDPKNSTALTAMADMQQQDPQTAESRIKSMLAKSPNDAGLYAALGNLYADQNRWSAAQQAYFDAFRLNESASNAFNLAVSLDQMGKPKLALPYYQQALQTVQQYGASGIDKAALEARIAAIQ